MDGPDAGPSPKAAPAVAIPSPSGGILQTNHHAKYSPLSAELYFLIAKFLKQGPLHQTGDLLVAELERQRVLPERTDWTGVRHLQSFEELEHTYAHISPTHLLELCARMPIALERHAAPSVAGLMSLLGAGRQSLLRAGQPLAIPRSLLDQSTRLHAMPLLDASNHRPANIVQVLLGRQMAGPMARRQAVQPAFYERMQLLRRTLGHLSAVYCVLFDRSGRYIITGADDLLVKLWSAIDGRLLATFRGASAEITDIAVNLDNTLLAAGSLDRILRVWDLQTAGPVAVLAGHTGMITSVNFSPWNNHKQDRFLVTTSTDGSVAFWQYHTPRHTGKAMFAPKSTQYHEKIRPGQAQMTCASFSPGGAFLATGSADHNVRVYVMIERDPRRIMEVEANSDTVDSIQWAHTGLRFVSGSKDGLAHVWHFEAQQWRPIRLNMADRLASCPAPDDDARKLRVTMVAWDFSDRWVVTAVNDFTIKVWHSSTGKLHRVMRGHKDELYVLESHPRDANVLISAGHDGQLFVWNVSEGVAITSFTNAIDGQGNGGVFDAKWSPDGSSIAATDSHGHLLMFGFGSGHPRLKLLPKELFFHTDYRPLVRDANHYVIDEQTQTIPHLMPPPFLVDVDGNPYPPALQRFVPGREACSTDLLVPNIAMGPDGAHVDSSVSELDRMIAALADRQGVPAEPAAMQAPAMPPVMPARLEGVRQSSGNWDRQHDGKWIRRSYVRPMQLSRMKELWHTTYAAGTQEKEAYLSEMRRRPMMINTGGGPGGVGGPLRPKTRASNRRTRRGGAGTAPAYLTRAARAGNNGMQSDENSDDPDNMASASSDDSNDSTAHEEMLEGMSSTSNDSDSSDYSDWVANDQPGQALEPPKRSRRKPVRSRRYSPGSSPDEDGPDAGGAGTNSSIDEPDDEPSSAIGDDGRPNGADGAPLNRSRRRSNGSALAGRGANGTTGGRVRRRAPQRIDPIFENGEIPERYRPPEWLSEVIPRKAPYYPQMGDDVVYFRQGHQRYLDAVRSKDVYRLPNNCEPWLQLEMREHEPVKVIGIKYEIRPPRLCCLKLAMLNGDGSLTGQSFTIKYHDMPDVLDFIVLQQTFDMAVRRLWQARDQFRCMIDDSWWTGCIESRTALDPEFPMSLFMCFRTRWDNGEFEAMSPWDMEPIDQNRLPEVVGGQVQVTPEELRATLYQPKSEEWPRGDRDATCRRIVAGLEEVMGLAIADPFLVPVDLNTYPSYAFMVEYPIDLTTIKARFENHFYRRLTSAQFDVRYLATNAEKFNQSNSSIVKHARIITDLCLRIIKDPNVVDVGAVYHQLMDTYVTSDSEAEAAAVDASVHTERSRSRVGSSAAADAADERPTRRSAASARSSRPSEDWVAKSNALLDIVWQREDSRPFREPVDLLEHPDYLASVDTPMDLRTVKEELLAGNYGTMDEFVSDMRLIFSNSRSYNTNARSRIYTMTLRLSSLFEAQLKTIMGKSFRRRLANGSTRRTSERRAQQPSTSADAVVTNEAATMNGLRSRRRAAAFAAAQLNGQAGPSSAGVPVAGPSNGIQSTVRQPNNVRQYRPVDSYSESNSDSDSDDIDVQSPVVRRNFAASSNGGSTAANAPSASQRLSAGDPATAGPSSTRASTRSRPTANGTSRTARRSAAPARSNGAARGHRRRDDDDDEDEDEDDEEHSDDSDVSDPSSDDDSDEDSDAAAAARQRRPKRPFRRCEATDDEPSGNDSEDSYNPDRENRTATAASSKKRRLVNQDAGSAVANGTSAASAGSSPSSPLVAVPVRVRRRPLALGSDDDDDEEDAVDDDDDKDEDYNEAASNRTPKKSAVRAGGSASAQKPRRSTAKKAPADALAAGGGGSSGDDGRRRSTRKQPQPPAASGGSGSRYPAGSTSSHKRRIQLDSEGDDDNGEDDDDDVLDDVAQAPAAGEDSSQDGQSAATTRQRRGGNGGQQQQQRRIQANRARPMQRNVADSDSGDSEETLSTLQRQPQPSTSSGARRSTRNAAVPEDDDDDDDDQTLSQLSCGYRSAQAAQAVVQQQPQPGPSRSAVATTRSNGTLRVARNGASGRRPSADGAPEAARYGEPGPSTVAARRRPASNGVDPEAVVGQRTRSLRNNGVAYGESDDDDDDDDTPLRYMAASRATVATTRGGQQLPVDERSSSSTRATRTQKRPYYNEDSDDEGARHAAATAAGRSAHKRQATVRRVARVDESDEPDDDEDDVLSAPEYANGEHVVGDDDAAEDDDETEASVSVSSRGRVRRITAKARGMFRE